MIKHAEESVHGMAPAWTQMFSLVVKITNEMHESMSLWFHKKLICEIEVKYHSSIVQHMFQNIEKKHQKLKMFGLKAMRFNF